MNLHAAARSTVSSARTRRTLMQSITPRSFDFVVLRFGRLSARGASRSKESATAPSRPADHAFVTTQSVSMRRSHHSKFVGTITSGSAPVPYLAIVLATSARPHEVDRARVSYGHRALFVPLTSHPFWMALFLVLTAVVRLLGFIIGSR